MLQKLQEYNWHIIIGISVIIMLFLMYQSYSTNKKVNMLYRCLNELSCRIEDVADSVATRPQSQVSKPQQPKRPTPIQQQSSQKQSSKELPPVSPKIKVQPSQQPVVSETIIFQVAPSPSPPPSRMTASTIEEIDSDDDSDVEVKETQMKDVDLDKALEAELSELNE